MLAKLQAEQPELAALLSKVRREAPGVLADMRASGQFAHLDAVARARAEIEEAANRLIPNAPAVRASIAAKARGAEDGIVVQSPGCGPCIAHIALVIGELIIAIGYTSKVATAPTGTVKAYEWAIVIGAWIVTAATLYFTVIACMTCPPAAAALSYAAYLVLALTATPIYIVACTIAAIFRVNMCF